MNKWVNLMVLRFVICSYVLLFSVTLGPEVYMAAGRNVFFVDSYIAEINTPYYGNDTTKQILERFNQYGNNKSVQWTTKDTLLSRPIYIKEVEQIVGRKSIIGQALPLWTSCHIVIEKRLDLETYRNVVLHEYLHCLGYTHSRNKKDLMYYSVNYCPEENIIEYAKEIEKRNK